MHIYNSHSVTNSFKCGALKTQYTERLNVMSFHKIMSHVVVQYLRATSIFMFVVAFYYSGFDTLYYSDFATLVLLRILLLWFCYSSFLLRFTTLVLLNVHCKVNTGSPLDIAPRIVPYRLAQQVGRAPMVSGRLLYVLTLVLEN